MASTLESLVGSLGGKATLLILRKLTEQKHPLFWSNKSHPPTRRLQELLQLPELVGEVTNPQSAHMRSEYTTAGQKVDV